MEKRLANYYLHRIYRLLSSNKVPIVFKRLKGRQGETDRETIWLNPNERLLDTLIHECLHVLYWSWSETQVNKITAQTLNKLSEKQVKNLLIKFAEAANRPSAENDST